ncbi:unnamed protein product [Rhizoctonia solani]|uniref:Uncharacterized protein n=1 Tax=Rhizoctonia solani TaxID=456999 RepID=A0A8H3BJK4_9AGAM|nr:unnamed protein product [Rhizoctonia solani]
MSSNVGSVGCVTCRARNKKRDQTTGPAGCQLCARDGLECIGHLAATDNWGAFGSIAKPEHDPRDQDPARRLGRTDSNMITASIRPQIPDDVSMFRGNDSGWPANNPEQHLDAPNWSYEAPVFRQNACLHPPTAVVHNQSSAPLGQQSYTPHTGLPVLPVQQNVSLDTLDVGELPRINSRRVGVAVPVPRPMGPMTPGQAYLFNSLFSLADDPLVLPYTSENIELSRGKGDGQQGSDLCSKIDSVDHESTDVDDSTCGQSEIILARMLRNLTLDRKVDSNAIPFVAHSFTAWMTRFLFEPSRVILLAQETITRGHFGEKALQRMILIANTVLPISKSTDYELTTYFMSLYTQLVNGVIEARAQSELTREAAMEAMESCHEIVSITGKVSSLANVLKLLELYAPIFRRACPEPSTTFVNLPRRLTSVEINLKYYATFDVLQSALTCRPMLFRYDLELLSPKYSELLDLADGPGLRWFIGVPDRLVFVLGKMNTLLEDHGNRIDSKTVQELEKEIRACKSVAWKSTGEEAALAIGRTAVQESWRLAGYVYLYMGLCGKDSSDNRVIQVQKQFMKILQTVKPRRIPDSFLLLPMMILGVAACSPADQSIYLTRLWGVPECNKSGTMGNDVVRILNDIWARTTERPIVWSDLRIACLRIVGM